MNPTDDTAVRPRRVGVLVLMAATALGLDVVSKILVVALLPDRPPIRLLGGLLTIRVLRNSGAAFNIGNGMTLVFTLIATGVVVAILRYARQLRSVPWAITLGLLLGGALGNLADRMFRAPGPLRGHVVDWIELPHWPVFNLADSSIVCGGALAVLLASRGLQVDGTVQRDEQAGNDVPAPDGPRTAASAGIVSNGAASDAERAERAGLETDDRTEPAVGGTGPAATEASGTSPGVRPAPPAGEPTGTPPGGEWDAEGDARENDQAMGQSDAPGAKY